MVVGNPREEERATRIRQARQVLAGDELQPPHEPYIFGERSTGLGPIARRYLFVVGALALISLLLYVIWGMGVASVVVLLLAIVLLAGWFIF